MNCGEKCSVLVLNVETCAIVFSLCSQSVYSKLSRLFFFHNITFFCLVFVLGIVREQRPLLL
jgi:hypothetical protein